tara:strand:- start:815 stop:1087 length:273 start_codon:yes stop_codon:yes gene_type:complete
MEVTDKQKAKGDRVMGLGIETLNDQIDVALKNINTVITGKDPLDMNAEEIKQLKDYLSSQLIILNNLQSTLKMIAMIKTNQGKEKAKSTG